ncbi:hypothetical protein ACSQ67_025555 [Phaseolus vulgaris]
MASFYFNPILTSSHLVSANLSRKFKIPKLLHRKKRFDGSPRSSKITSFYGLKTPPYELDALEPHMSKKTIDKHWGEHQRNFIEGLNKQLEKDDKLYGYTLDELVKVTYNSGNPFPEFNNAAEGWLELKIGVNILTRNLLIAIG